MAGRGQHAHMALVDQSTNTLRKVEEYIDAGMENAIDTALDIVEHNKDKNDSKISDVQNIMLQYVQMEYDLKRFLQAVQYVRDKAKTDPSLDLTAVLDEKLEELKKDVNPEEFTKHEKYVDLEQKIKEAVNPDGDLAVPGCSTPMLADEDLAMTQAEVNTKCPYTGQEMQHPMKNKHCGHNYDRDGINDLIRNRGTRAKCPVGGCRNDKVLEMSDLEENKELKRFIERKMRQAGKRTKKAPQATVLSP